MRPAEDGGQAEERIEVAPRGFFEVSRRNLWGKNRSVSLLTRVSFRPRDPAVDSDRSGRPGGYGFNEYRVVGTFREPRPFDAAGDLQLTAFLEQAIRSSFNFSRRGVRAEYARRLRQRSDRQRPLCARADAPVRREDSCPRIELLIDRLFPQVRLSTLTGSVLRDSRDDVLDPERGTRRRRRCVARRASDWVRKSASSSRFVAGLRLSSAARRAQLTLAAGVRLGLAVGFERLVEHRDGCREPPVLGPDGQPIVDVVADLPASERFFAGGDTTVRGFVLDRLGTEETLQRGRVSRPAATAWSSSMSSCGRPIGRAWAPWASSTPATSSRAPATCSFSELRPTAGFGVRYRSPLGPLRVDLGFNLDPSAVLPAAPANAARCSISRWGRLSDDR